MRSDLKHIKPFSFTLVSKSTLQDRNMNNIILQIHVHAKKKKGLLEMGFSFSPGMFVSIISINTLTAMQNTNLFTKQEFIP